MNKKQLLTELLKAAQADQKQLAAHKLHEELSFIMNMKCSRKAKSELLKIDGIEPDDQDAIFQYWEKNYPQFMQNPFDN